MASKNEIPPQSDDTIKKEAEVVQEAAIKQSHKEKLIELAKNNKIDKEGLKKMGLSREEVNEILDAIKEGPEVAEAKVVEETKADTKEVDESVENKTDTTEPVNTVDPEKKEGEKTPEEVLEEARSKYAEEYLKFKKEQSRKIKVKKVKNSILNIFREDDKQVKVNEEDFYSKEHLESKKAYDLARIELGNKLFTEEKARLETEGLTGKDLEDKLAEYKMTEVLQKVVVDERQKLIELRANNPLIEPAKWKQFVSWYAKQPRWKKVALSTGIFMGLAATGVVGGAAASGGLATMGITKFVKGMTLGTVIARFSKGTVKLVDKAYKGSDEKFKSDQAEKLADLKNKFATGEISLEELESFEKGNESLIIEEKKRERNRMLLKASVGIAVGMGSGALAYGMVNSFEPHHVQVPVDQHLDTPPAVTPHDVTPVQHDTVHHAVKHHNVTPVKHHGMELPKPEKVDAISPTTGDFGDNGQPIAPREGVFNTNTDGPISPKNGDFGQTNTIQNPTDAVKSQFEINNPQKTLDEVDFKTQPAVRSEFLNQNPQTELPKVQGTDVDHPVKTGLSEFEKANPQKPLEEIVTPAKPVVPVDQSTIKSEFLNKNPQTELPKALVVDATNPPVKIDDIPKVTAAPVDQNVLTPLRPGEMSPTRGIYNVTANSTENFSNPNGSIATSVPGDNGFTREVPLTKEVPMTNAEEYEYLNRTGSGPRMIPIQGTNTYEVGNHQGALNIEQDPRHVETISDLKKEIGRYDYKHNTIIEKPEQETINDVDYKDWNKGIDHMLQEKNVKFNSYESYEKERELETLFGNGKKVVEYVPSLDKNVEVLKVNYFRELPEWKIASRVPANYFVTDFDHAQEMVNGKLIDMPKADFDQLIKAGILKPKLNIDGTQAGGYEYAHKSELLRISKTYSKLLTDKDIELGNDKPLITPKGPETIENYVGRVMKPTHQAEDGTLFVFKKNIVIEKNTTDGMVVATERIPSRIIQNGVISPTNGIYQNGSYYNPNYGLASRAVDLIFGNRGSSSPVRMFR